MNSMIKSDKKMIQIESNRLILRELNLDDVTSKYISWLNDPVINKSLESRFTHHTHESVKQFIEGVMKNSNDILFGIFDKKNKKHIGNIRIHSSDKERLHNRASIGFLIGDKSEWGKGYATEAIKLVTEYAFKNLKILKICAGCHESNIGSKKAMERCGYKVEGFFDSHFESENGRKGGWQLGILPDKCE